MYPMSVFWKPELPMLNVECPVVIISYLSWILSLVRRPQIQRVLPVLSVSMKQWFLSKKRIWGTMIGRQNLTIFGCYLSNKTKTQNIIAKSQSPSIRWLSNVHKLVPRPPHDSYNMYAPQFTSPQIVKVIWSSWQRSWSSILTLGWTMLWQSWWPWRLTKGAKKTAKSTMKLLANISTWKLRRRRDKVNCE